MFIPSVKFNKTFPIDRPNDCHYGCKSIPRTISLESDLSECLQSENGKGKQKQKERRTTLVIAPACLLQQVCVYIKDSHPHLIITRHQWYEEITEKTNGIFRVHIHHGKKKLKSVEEIEGYDVWFYSIIDSSQSNSRDTKLIR